MKNRLLLTANVLIVAFTIVIVAPQATCAPVASELEYARNLLKEGMPDVAREELERFLEGEVPVESRQDAMLLLGDIRSSGSEFAEAARLYLGAYEVNPDGDGACTALFRAGECALHLKRYRDASSTFSHVAARFPECSYFCAALRNVGVAFFRRGDFDQAAKEFERGLALCEDEEWEAELLYWQAEALSRTSVERAKDVFGLLLKKHGGSSQAFRGSLRLAELLREEGDLRGALRIIDEALSYRVGKELLGKGLFERAGLLDRLGRTRQAALTYAECSRTSPDSSLSQECNLRAQEGLLSVGEHRQADSLAEKLLMQGPSERNRLASLLTRARAARSRGGRRDALGFLAQAQCLHPADSLCVELALEEGGVKEELGDGEGAAVAYLRALTLPGDDELHAFALMRLGALSADRMSTDRTGKGEPAGPAETAKAFYTLLIGIYPASTKVQSAMWELARLSEATGDFSEAATAYRRLARDFPLGAHADEAVERATLLNALFPSEVGTAELKRLRALIASAAGGSPAGDRLLEEAAVLFESNLHSFVDAEALLSQGLMSSPPERKHVMLLRLGGVHRLLAKRSAFEGKVKDSEQHRAAARRYLRDLTTQYGRTQLADDGALALIEMELEALEPPDSHSMAVSHYTEFLQNYPNTDRFEEALIGRARALTELFSEPGDRYYTEALASFQKLIDEFPESPLLAEARYGKGHLLRAAGHIDAAETEFEIVLSVYPGSAPVSEAAYELGECKLARRDLDRAISLYEFAFENGKTRILRERALSRKGDCFLVRGELEKAVREYEYILKYHATGPFADDLLARLAEAYLKRGMLEEASGPEGRLSKQFPKSRLLRRVLLEKAEVEERAGQLARAASTYLRLYEEFPETRGDSTVMLAYGRVSFKSGDYQSSVEAYERTLGLVRSRETRREAGRCLVLALARTGEEADARKRLDWYERSFPEDSTLAAEVSLERGLSLYDAGDLGGAYDRLSEALGKLSREPRKRALVAMGMSKLKQKEFAQASKHFGESVRTAPADSALDFTAYYKSGTSLYAQSMYLQASNAYLSASRLTTDPSVRCDTWFNSALCLERAEKWSEAASLYDEIGRGCKGKQARGAAFKSGYCQLNAGHNRSAIGLLREALDVVDEKEKAEVQYWLGEAYAAMGEFDRAASEFLKVPFVYGDGSLWAVTARYKAGMAFERTGDVEAAMRQYRILIEKEGEGSQWGSMAKERLLELSR